MNFRFRGILAAVIAAALPWFAASAGHAECQFKLTDVQLLQCRPIERVENSDHKPTWTYVDDQTKTEGGLAHILCSCDTAAPAQPQCEDPRPHQLTFTLETRSIRETCAKGPALCQGPCSKLISGLIR